MKKESWKAKRDEKVTGAIKSLEDGIESFTDAESFKAYLKTVSKFHTYSWGNQILIHRQKTDATYVAGFSTWKKLERNVKKGEKGIMILCPTPYKSKEIMKQHNLATGEEEEVETEVSRIGFKVGYVFDLSQTEGKPLALLDVRTLEGDVLFFKDFMTAAESISTCPITIADVKGEAKGFYRPSEHSITIKAGMSELQTMKTLIHEMAHSIMHHDSPDTISRDSMEIEAESVAFCVCSYFGLDTSDYSFSYLGSWGEEHTKRILKSSLPKIQQTVNDMIEGLDNEMIRLDRGRTIYEIMDLLPDKNFETLALEIHKGDEKLLRDLKVKVLEGSTPDEIEKRKVLYKKVRGMMKSQPEEKQIEAIEKEMIR